MASKPYGLLLGLTLLAVSLPASPVWADAIDGHWCFADGRTFSIDGSRIVTPAGTRTTGDYDRHAFSYTVPAGEAGSGSAISMDLVDDDTIHLQAGPGAVQTWRRCSDVTS
jgi:hypothetical protein